MNNNDGLAPPVRAILSNAATRSGGFDRLSVNAQSLSRALKTAEQDGRVPIIAEIKPTSPTATTHQTADPVRLAKAMVDGGAAALSVLTEPAHFSGSPTMLENIRSAVDVPVLRKDFILSENHLDIVAADVILLIVRFVDDLASLLSAAQKRGFHVLVETHTVTEVETALEAGSELIGINNRDLAKLEVDLTTFETVAPSVPKDVTLIAESGIHTPKDVDRMRSAGADGLLIGSAIMNLHSDDTITPEIVRQNTKQLCYR